MCSPSYFPIPGLGVVPVNAFVLKATEPVLVDAGADLPQPTQFFMKNLAAVINPAELRWLWLTHADQDHIGSLARACWRRRRICGSSPPISARGG